MSGRQVISPEAHEPDHSAHYAVATADGEGTVQAWIDLLQTTDARRVDAAVTRQALNMPKTVNRGVSGLR